MMQSEGGVAAIWWNLSPELAALGVSLSHVPVVGVGRKGIFFSCCFCREARRMKQPSALAYPTIERRETETDRAASEPTDFPINQSVDA